MSNKHLKTLHGVRQGRIASHTRAIASRGSIGSAGSQFEGGNPYARLYAKAIADGRHLHEHRPSPVRTLAQMTPEERAEMVRLYSRKAK